MGSRRPAGPRAAWRIGIGSMPRVRSRPPSTTGPRGGRSGLRGRSTMPRAGRPTVVHLCGSCSIRVANGAVDRDGVAGEVDDDCVAGAAEDVADREGGDPGEGLGVEHDEGGGDTVVEDIASSAMRRRAIAQRSSASKAGWSTRCGVGGISSWRGRWARSAAHARKVRASHRVAPARTKKRSGTS